MADDPKDPKAGGTGGAPAGDGGGIKAAVREVLAELGIGGKKDEDQGGAPGDLNSQVAEAVRQVREGDEAARQRAKTEERLAALEAAKKTPEPEKAPSENRWIERVMGWVEREQ